MYKKWTSHNKRD